MVTSSNTDTVSLYSGGNAKTLMFVNISPADYNSQETKLSLYWGDNAKKIKNEVSKHMAI